MHTHSVFNTTLGTQRMFMNDKIIFDCYYCINSAKMKEVMVQYILQPRHIFIIVKAFILMLVPGGLQLLIISTCFVWCPVTSINKCGVLTAHAQCHVNHLNYTWLFSLLISCDTGFYAIIRVTGCQLWCTKGVTKITDTSALRNVRVSLSESKMRSHITTILSTCFR